jgi:hypothetical protein
MARAGERGWLEPISVQVRQLVRDLDSQEFRAREKAAQELAERGHEAEAALRALLAGQPSAEVRRRAEALLEQLEPSRFPERLGELRALEVLEVIGTREAREVLATLVQGAPHCRLTEEAKASLGRLTRAPAGTR